MNLRSSRWAAEYKRLGALWIHDGAPLRPHALLTSGKHSEGFFNSGLVMSEPSLAIQACADLIAAVDERIQLTPVQYVIGPAFGAVVMAHCMAYELGQLVGRECRSAFTEKTSDGMKLRFQLPPNSEVLVVEDVITTGGSVDRTIEVVTHAGGHVAPVVATLVDRSGGTSIRGGREIVSLIQTPMQTWEPNDCPYCAAGSVAIRPKGSENWEKLNANYPAKGVIQ